MSSASASWVSSGGSSTSVASQKSAAIAFCQSARFSGRRTVPVVTARVFASSVCDHSWSMLPRRMSRPSSSSRLAEQTQETQYRAMIGREQAAAEAHLGLVEQARASAEAALAAARMAGDATYTVWNLAVLGNIELALGNSEQAAAQLRELPGRVLAMGQLDPGDSDVWSDTIEALLAAGELEQAATYVEEYARFVARGSRRL